MEKTKGQLDDAEEGMGMQGQAPRPDRPFYHVKTMRAPKAIPERSRKTKRTREP